MSHEQSITIQDKNGKWVNISTVYNGKKISSGRAEDLFNQGLIKPLSGKTYNKLPTAEYMATKRSTQSREPGTRQGIRPPGAKR